MIHANKFNKIGKVLSRYEPSSEELHIIMTQLLQLGKHSQLCKILSLHYTIITSTHSLLHIVLESCYRSENYSLYESLFAVYLKLPDELQPQVFNWALKIFLRTNTEFAKQLLYQMVYSQYPMDRETIYSFITIANRVSTFPTIRFVLEILKNNANVPVDSRALGQLIFGFLRNGKSKDILELEAYLTSMGKDTCIDVQMGRFMHKVVLSPLPMSMIWQEVESFASGITDVAVSMRFYNWLYHLLKLRMTMEDMSTYVSMAQASGYSDSPLLRRRILLNIALMGETQDLLDYLLLVHTRKSDESHCMFEMVSIWKAWMINQPDKREIIVRRFTSLISRLNVPWRSEALALLKHEMVVPGRVSLKGKDANDMLLLLNDSLRDGKRPSVSLMTQVLKQLVLMRSHRATEVYSLIEQLISPIPPHLQLLWFTNTTQFITRPECQSSIERYLVENGHLMRHQEYATLAELALKRGIHNVILDIILRATQSPLYRVDKDTVRLYFPALSLMARSGKHVEFLAMCAFVERQFVLDADLLGEIDRFGKMMMMTFEDEVELQQFQGRYKRQFEEMKSAIEQRRLASKGHLDETVKLLER